MSIPRWDPFQELEATSARLNRLVSHLPTLSLPPYERPGLPVAGVAYAPPVDIIETPEEFLIKADLPEMRREDVHVAIENGMIRIEGERKTEKEELGRKFHRIERVTGTFMRSFTLPVGIEQTKVRAEFKDGVLALRLPKLETARPKAIEVKVN